MTIRNNIQFLLNDTKVTTGDLGASDTLLDFLRLRTKYDRVCWNLKPVIWAHEILVRRGVNDAAKMWRITHVSGRKPHEIPICCGCGRT